MFLTALVIGASALAGGVWEPVGEGEIAIRFTKGMDFEKFAEEVGGPIKCTTVWPIKSPQAFAKCEDGESHRLYFDMNQGVIIFDLLALTKHPERK